MGFGLIIVFVAGVQSPQPEEGAARDGSDAETSDGSSSECSDSEDLPEDDEMGSDIAETSRCDANISWSAAQCC